MERLPGWTLAALVVALGVTATSTRVIARQQPPAGADERLAQLKQSLQESKARLVKYEWIQTTTISLKGEEKNRKQERCYYGADGKLQKVPVGSTPEPPAAQGGGRRGGRLKQRIIEKKKGELQDEMESAAALVHSYVPPDPADVERARQNGRMAVRPGRDGRVHLEFTSYLKDGDLLAIDLDTVANTIAGLTVASYLDTPEDAVALTVQVGTLTEGTSYVAETTLDVVAKNLRVVVQNSGYRIVSQ